MEVLKDIAIDLNILTPGDYLCESNSSEVPEESIVTTRIELIDIKNSQVKWRNQIKNNTRMGSTLIVDLDSRKDIQKIRGTKTLSIILRNFKYLSSLTIRKTKGVKDEEEIVPPRRYNKKVEEVVLDLENLTSLSNLRLDFSGCYDIIDRSLGRMFRSISNLTNLLELSFIFNLNDKVTNGLLYDLSLCFRRLPFLFKLELSFSWCGEFDDEGMESISKGIKYMVDLPILKLILQNCSGITNRSLESLGYCFKKLKCLSTLHLNISDNPQISDSGVGSLSFGLSQLSSLIDLDLNFGNYVRMTDEGIRILSKAIEHLPLTKLSLNLWNCKGLRDLTLVELSECVIMLMNSLSHVNLDFRNCHEITDDGVKIFCEYITLLTSISSIKINMQNCSLLTDKSLSYFKQIRSIRNFKCFLLSTSIEYT